MLKKANTRLLTRAGQNRDCVFRGAYRTATRRGAGTERLFRQPAKSVSALEEAFNTDYPGVRQRFPKQTIKLTSDSAAYGTSGSEMDAGRIALLASLGRFDAWKDAHSSSGTLGKQPIYWPQNR